MSDSLCPKSRIVDTLGERELLLPVLIEQALEANDQVKVLMSVLQAARSHADHPELEPLDLRHERLACGMEEGGLDDLVMASRREGPGHYSFPGRVKLHSDIVQRIERMLEPVERCPLPADGSGVATSSYRRRLARIQKDLERWNEDRVDEEYVERVTSGDPRAPDSLHRLVMDLHRELNRVQRQLAMEVIDAARVYGLTAEDRPLVTAFMAGVNRTAPLKFDHPGLGTTAMRAGERLVIQNDLGTTDAHVVVIHVDGLQVRLMHTDVHLQRLLFFQSLFEGKEVAWDDTHSRRAAGLSEGIYHLCSGTRHARDLQDLQQFLEFLGSRLVYLIDWNRARKRLRKLAPRKIVLRVLRWGADNDVGHMAFLKLGGEQLLYALPGLGGRTPLQLGGQLSDILGPESTTTFLQFTLRTTAEGLLAQKSELLIRDEIAFELRRHIDSAHEGFLELAMHHASLIVELAMAAQETLIAAAGESDPGFRERAAERARRWEHEADELVMRIRQPRIGGGTVEAVPELLLLADDAADGLEEAVFLASLLKSPSAEGEFLSRIQELARSVALGSREYLKAVSNAHHLHRGSTREQIDDFLQAIASAITCEHRTDEAHRRSVSCIADFPGDFRQLHLFSRIATQLEGAADALMRSSWHLRDHVMDELISH